MRYEFRQGTSSKFWDIELSGKSFTVTFGRIGSQGQAKKQSFASPALAQAAHDKLVAEKTKKGYAAVGAPAAAPAPAPPRMPREEKLEAAIRNHPDAAESYVVYADWLQEHRSAHGELIVVQHALATGGKDKKLAARATKLISGLGLPDKDVATFGWKWGFFEWCRLHNTRDWMDDKFDATALARSLFSTPMAAAMQELRVGVLRWEYNHDDVPAVLKEAAKQPWARSLKRLRLGDIADEDIDMAHHVVGDVGKLIAKTFPALESLTIHSGSQGWHSGAETFGVSGLDLPQLRELVIETCAMTKKRLKAILTAKLPRLTKLELWFGSPESDSNVVLRDLEPLLARKVFPNLTSLGLCNAEFTEELARRLPGTDWPARLETMDLKMGTLDDEHARGLAASAKKWKKLKTLDVSKSWLTKPVIAELTKAFAGCTVLAADQQEMYEGEDRRYASVQE